MGNIQYSAGIYHDLIVGIIAALEAKDIATANHSMRVSDMVEQTCGILGMPFAQTEMVHLAAHVHDIGKIGVPDSVLFKAGKLTEEEWTLMKRHPLIGAGILQPFPGLAEVASMILHHHERWDGAGYPHGLKKEEIPLGSRIIAICDSIDAMMSYRPYHRIFSPGECKAEIAGLSGVMYDPHIASCVLAEWEAIVDPIAFERSQTG